MRKWVGAGIVRPEAAAGKGNLRNFPDIPLTALGSPITYIELAKCPAFGPNPPPRSPRIPPFDRSAAPPRPPTGPRMNEQIRITPIRLIGAEGEQHGILPTLQAQEMARELGMDLVEVAPTERPPVCKIMDFGKHKYAQSKKTAHKPHQQKLKELRVRPKTGEHDVDTRVNQARKFLEHGDKVIIKVQFRGREMQHIEEGRRIMDQMLEKLLEVCKLEKPPAMEGKQMTALLAPKATGGK